MRGRNKRCLKSLAIGGLLAGICTFLQYFAFPKAVQIYITNNLYLHPKSITWEPWENVPFPLTVEMYFFNVTNPEEIRKLGAKPKLQEIGKYTYKQWRQRHNATLKDDGGTVTYLESDTFYFDPSQSDGREDDLVTTLNMPLVAAASSISNLAEWRLSGYFVNRIFQTYNQKLFVTRSVREILFDGYDNPLLPYSKFFTSKAIFKDNKFSLFGMKNGTKYGPYIMKTGKDNILHLGKITSYGGAEAMSMWTDKYCEMINGTDGTIFPPFVRRTKKLYVFSKESCRSFSLDYKEHTISNGFSVNRFISSYNNLAGPRENPDNACFCMESSSDNCPLSGLFDNYPCTDVHLLTSNPHFYQADKSLLQDVDGLQPDAAKHGSYTDLEPDMGIPIRIITAGQLNVALRPYQSLEEFLHVPKVVFPILWVKAQGDIPDDYARLVRLAYILPKTLVSILCCIGQIAGVLFIITGFVLMRKKPYIYGKVSKPKSEPSNGALLGQNSELLLQPCNAHQDVSGSD